MDIRIPPLALLFCISPAAAETPEEQGLRIAHAVEKANNGFIGEESVMEMTLFNAHGDQVVRRMSSLTQETKQDGDRSLSTFLWPADVKGTRMLTWTHKESDDDQWLFLPAIKRVKRISSRNKSGSFMGSEFSYEDLGSQEPEKFIHKHLRDEVKDGRESWVLERIPTYRSGYSRIIVWIDREYMNPTRIEYYDRKGEILKTAVFGQYVRFRNFYRPETLEMTNHQTRKRSTLLWKDRKLYQSYLESDFDNKNLDNEG